MNAPRIWLRRARREAGSTSLTVGVLAIAIAASVVVYRCVDRLVLNPLPLPDAASVVIVGSEMPRIQRSLRFFEPLSGPELERVMTGTTTLTALLAFDMNSVRMQAGDFPARLFGAFTWTDPLPALGVDAALGRGFSADEVARGDRVAILSDASWTRDFGRDPGIVGRSIELDGAPYSVVGVLPPYATFYGVDVWVPMTDRMTSLPRDRRQFNLLARLGDGKDLGQVEADLERLAREVERDWGRESEAYRGWHLRGQSFARQNAFAYADEAVLSLAAVTLILILVCVNLGNLSVVRAVAQRPAAATRLALGASRRALALDAAGEALTLAAAGGLSGAVLATIAFAVLDRRLPGVLQPLGPPLSVGARGLAFAVVATVVAGLVLAGAAVAAGRGTRPRHILDGGARTHGSRGLRRIQRGMVVAQLALGLALASGAGAVGLAVARVLAEDPGFAVDDILSMRLSLPAEAYGEGTVPIFFETLTEAVRGLPGVATASVATQVAPTTFFSAEIDAEGIPESDGSRPRLGHTVVGDDYFSSMGIGIVAGRGFDARDRRDGPPVVVVNEAAARRLFPGDDPLGRRVRVRGTSYDSGWAEVVGVAADVRNQGQGAPTEPEVFTVHRQAGDRYRQMFLVVRADGDPAALLPAIREEVRRLDPAQPVYAIATARASLAQQTAPRRIAAFLLTGLSVLAILLAALGLNGVLSYALASRRSELAVRASLGADAGTLRGLLVRDVLSTTVAGLAVGTVLTAWLGWALRSALGDAAAWSSPVVAGAVGLLVLAATLAALGPALRVGRTDPVDVLRASG